MARTRAWIWIPLGFVLATSIAWLAIAVIIQGRPVVVERWNLYVERLSPERKLLVLSSAQRYTASKEFTAKVLAIVQVKASITIEAWADVFYVVDASDPRAWTIGWNRKTKVLSLSAPEPSCLPPAVRTDTIEIRTKGANLLTNTIFRLKEEARKLQSELSAELAVKAKAALSEETLRSGMRAGLTGIGRSFCQAALGVEPASVVVRFSGDRQD
ncbi:MAG: hypothetical protein NT061_00645 [Spirochaetes bacterium]|nr:hypothetical protein [Spirochaetota bacterium]